MHMAERAGGRVACVPWGREVAAVEVDTGRQVHARANSLLATLCVCDTSCYTSATSCSLCMCDTSG